MVVSVPLRIDVHWSLTKFPIWIVNCLIIVWHKLNVTQRKKNRTKQEQTPNSSDFTPSQYLGHTSHLYFPLFCLLAPISWLSSLRFLPCFLPPKTPSTLPFNLLSCLHFKFIDWSHLTSHLHLVLSPSTQIINALFTSYTLQPETLCDASLQHLNYVRWCVQWKKVSSMNTPCNPASWGCCWVASQGLQGANRMVYPSSKHTQLISHSIGIFSPEHLWRLIIAGVQVFSWLLDSIDNVPFHSGPLGLSYFIPQQTLNDKMFLKWFRYIFLIDAVHWKGIR